MQSKNNTKRCRWPAKQCVEKLRALRRQGRDRPVIMVSSTVYGIESLLEQIYGMLLSAGWDVWMSRRGTVPVDSDMSNFDNCLQAVNDCDAFLGIITGSYGSGKIKTEKSITHQEMERAIKSGRKRWFLVQHEVAVARQFFRAVKKAVPHIESRLTMKHNPLLDDLRILDMYDLAVRDSEPVENRTGNWVQAYRNTQEAMLFIESQLGHPEAIFPEYFAKAVRP
ncbi:MAG: DUF4062 domain-containing protein [Candidatus Sumerlaeota bacterium]|nr:DUF4062 domain-containing protein [Candidatus Sumerlaeota bacterium]